MRNDWVELALLYSVYCLLKDMGNGKPCDLAILSDKSSFY